MDDGEKGEGRKEMGADARETRMSKDLASAGVTHPMARVLVVEDEPYIREVLCRWLAADEYECTSAPDGEAALEALEAGYVELVLTDIMMPGMSGMTLLEEVKKRFPDVAVVMATALDDRKQAIRAVELGAYGYLIKPLDQNEVLINVTNALERRRLTLIREKYQQRLEEEVRNRTAEVRRTQEEITWRLVSASEYRDEETGAHIRRMGQYAVTLAEAAGWKGQAAADIRLAAPMHDIGKIGVPDTILLKPGKLTPEEFDRMKKHTMIGAQILGVADIPLIRTAKEIAVSHHEKWDGSGYPEGLAGEAIPECARMVAVCDVYDALVTHRVYRPAFPEEEALAMMTKEKGKHFDPKLFDGFMDMLPEFRRIREEIDEPTGTAQGHRNASPRP